MVARQKAFCFLGIKHFELRYILYQSKANTILQNTMSNNISKQLTTLALCGFIFVFSLIGINVSAQDSLKSDYSGTKCPMGQIRINNKCVCDPNKPTFKACIKKQLKDVKATNFVNAILESAGDPFSAGGLLIQTIKVSGSDYLDANLSVTKSVIYVGQDNDLIIENIQFKDADGQLISASLIQTTVVITTPSGRKITLKVNADMSGSFSINLSPKLKGLIQETAFNPFGSVDAQAADATQYTVLNGDLRDLEQQGDFSAYVTLTNANRELMSRSVTWKTIQDPSLITTVVSTVNNTVRPVISSINETVKPVANVTKPLVDTLSRTGVNSSTLLAGLALITTASITYFMVKRKKA